MTMIGTSISDAYNKYKNNKDPEISKKIQKWQSQGKEILIFKKEPEGIDRLKALFGVAVQAQWEIGTFSKNSDKSYKIKVCEELIHGISANADLGLLRIKAKAQDILSELKPKIQVTVLDGIKKTHPMLYSKIEGLQKTNGMLYGKLLAKIASELIKKGFIKEAISLTRVELSSEARTHLVSEIFTHFCCGYFTEDIYEDVFDIPDVDLSNFPIDSYDEHLLELLIFVGARFTRSQLQSYAFQREKRSYVYDLIETAREIQTEALAEISKEEGQKLNTLMPALPDLPKELIGIVRDYDRNLKSNWRVLRDKCLAIKQRNEDAAKQTAAARVTN